MRKSFKKMVAPFVATALFWGTFWTTPILAEENPVTDSLKQLSEIKISDLSKDPAQRLGGVDRYETAVKISQAGWANDSSDFAILSAGMDDNLVDSLTAAPLAHYKEAPILLTEGNVLNPFTEQELQRLGVKTVYVTSGTGVITQAVLDKLKEMDIQVVSLGGRDRFETSLNIAKELGTFNKVIVSTAYNNADALSVASIAASQGIPIILCDVAQIPQTVKEYLNTKQIEESYVLGGEGALSATVEQNLPNPKRLGGTDRFETNVKIIEAFNSVLGNEKAYLASGNDRNLVDALAGSSLAAKTSSMIILTDNQALPIGTRDFVKKNMFPIVPSDLVVLGGASVVPEQVINDMTSMIVYDQNEVIVGTGEANQPQNVNDNVAIVCSGETHPELINGYPVADKYALVKGLSTPYNVYVEGTKIILSNITVQDGGTLILNPGAQGQLRLENVVADHILVLSGEPDGIDIIDSKIGTLLVGGVNTNPVGVTALGTTSIEQTIASSVVNLDSSGGDFGKIFIAQLGDVEPKVQLQGDFYEEVVVTAGVVTRTGLNRLLPTLYVVSTQKVELKGNYNDIIVTTPTPLIFEEGSAMRLIANKDADLSGVTTPAIVGGITRQ